MLGKRLSNARIPLSAATPREDDGDRFRKRARDCRKIADEAKTADWRESLLNLAKDLEDEADKTDAEDGD